MPNKYLSNMANILAITFCKENNIDCSGTHLIKYPRKQIYALTRDEDGYAVVTVTLHTNQVPTYSYHK